MPIAGLEPGKDGAHLHVREGGVARLEAGPEHVAGDGASQAWVLFDEGIAQLRRLGLKPNALIAAESHPDMLLPL